MSRGRKDRGRAAGPAPEAATGDKAADKAAKPAGGPPLKVRVAGVEVSLPAAKPDAPLPESWHGVLRDVNRSLIGTVAYVFRLPKTALASLISLLRGVGNLPDTPPGPPPENVADVDQLAELARDLAARGVQIRIEQTDGRTVLFVASADGAAAVKRLPAGLLPPPQSPRPVDPDAGEGETAA